MSDLLFFLDIQVFLLTKSSLLGESICTKTLFKSYGFCIILSLLSKTIPKFVMSLTPPYMHSHLCYYLINFVKIFNRVRYYKKTFK